MASGNAWESAVESSGNERWILTIPDDEGIGVDEGGLTLTTPDNEAWFEIGGIPED